MTTLTKIAYSILILSLIPIMITYFAYGNALDMAYLVITLLFAAGLVYSIIKPSKQRIPQVVFLLGCLFSLLQLYQLQGFWFNNKGGDPRVTIAFSLQWIYTLIVVYTLFKASRY